MKEITSARTSSPKTYVMNIFEQLKDLDWQEDPEVSLSEWRVRLPSCADGPSRAKSAQFEFMRARGPSDSEPFVSMIVSVVAKDGSRGPEALLDLEQLRNLRALLNASDLSGT